MKPADQAFALLFLHVPKTAGMTLSNVLRARFAIDAILRIEGPPEQAAERLACLPAAARECLRCVYGHFAFGLHAALPRPACYVTLVRDPVERLASIYHYALRRPEWGLHRALVERGMKLDEFVASPLADEFHDQQTRMLSGRLAGALGAPDLAAALRHVEEWFLCAGPTERFDDVLAVLTRRLGWPRIAYAPANVNRRRPPLDAVSPALRERIASRNPLDVALHRAVSSRFDEFLAAEPIAPEHRPRKRPGWLTAGARLLERVARRPSH